MSEETPKQLVQRFLAAMNAHDVNAAKACLAKDFVRYGSDMNWAGMPCSEYLGLWDNFFEPFPDLKWDIQTIVAEGDQVAVSLIESATMTRVWHHRGRELQPNGKAYEIHTGLFMTVRDGVIQHYKYIGNATPNKGFMDVYGDLLGGNLPEITRPLIHVED